MAVGSPRTLPVETDDLCRKYLVLRAGLPSTSPEAIVSGRAYVQFGRKKLHPNKGYGPQRDSLFFSRVLDPAYSTPSAVLAMQPLGLISFVDGTQRNW